MLRSPLLRFAVVSLASGSLLVGCGGGTRDGAAVAEVPRPLAPPRGDGVLGAVDTSQPTDLAVLLRMRSPEETVDAASFVSGTPLSLLLTMAMQVEESLGAIDLAAPVDVAVVLPPGAQLYGKGEDEEGGPAAAPKVEPLAAIAFGVTQVERFITSFPGGSAPRTRRDGSVQIANDDLVCTLPVAQGPARAVCGSSVEAVRRLGPWMTTTLAREPRPADDAHVVFLAAPARAAIRDLVASDLRGSAAEAREQLAQLGIGDPELLAVPNVVLDEMVALADDADRFELAFDLDPKTRTVSTRATARFRGTSSWTARVLADPAERRGPPPAIFWRAPKDSDAATWALSSSPRHFAGMRRVVSKAVSLAMSRAGATPDETAALVGVVDGIPSYGGAWASAQGSLPWNAPGKGGATPQNAVADLKNRSRALIGWGVGTIEAPAGPWITWVTDVEKAWKKLQTSANRALPGTFEPDTTPEVRIVRAPVGYPTGSVALDVIVKIDSELAWETSSRRVDAKDGLPQQHPPGPRAKGSMTFRLVVAPDGDRTFIGWSLDDTVLRARIRSMLRAAPATGTIASRTDLKRLERPGTGGGYFSLRSWVDLVLELAESEADSPDKMALVKEAISAMPNRAATPILSFSDGTAGPAPTLSFELMVQEGTVDDLRALGQFAVGKGLKDAFGGMGSEKKTEESAPLQGPAGRAR